MASLSCRWNFADVRDLTSCILKLLTDREHHLRNVVLPFFVNWYLYLVVGIIETGLGAFSIAYRGRKIVNGIILTFVGIIIWYRWAFFYAGGVRCDCTGLLAKLFHFTHIEEKVVPIITLIYSCADDLARNLSLIQRSSLSERHANNNLTGEFSSAGSRGRGDSDSRNHRLARLLIL